MTKLILFDIDGTLVLTGGAGMRAMARAFEEVFGVPGPHDVPLNGRTDAWIVAQTAARYGFTYSEADLLRFHDVYIRHLEREVQEPGPRKGMMPGVRPLLDTLVPRGDTYVALLTGNFEQGARVKLEYFDLWRYFRCGAFGDRVLERNALLPVALEEVHARCGVRFACEDTVVVGDTPFDVAVASTGGARSIAVATGSHSVAALGECGADVVLPNLADVQQALSAMGLA